MGENPRFTFERDSAGRPMFEDFAKRSVPITHHGRQFALYGTCDGIMQYVAEDGRVIRVGLEIKSKQTTYAQTSDYSQRNGPKEDHVKQCVCYSLMYDVDYYIILYVNGSKKGWVLTDEEYAKNRDIKAHGIEITDDMRSDILDHFTSIVEAASIGEAPTLDIGKWTFNNYKTACAASLSDEEMAALQRQVDATQRSGLQDYKKRQFAEAFEDIKRKRMEATA